jgi:hypothetical protein
MVALAGACAGHVKRETIGGGMAGVQARGTVESSPATSINISPGTYEVKMRFELPRAQLVEWTVLCPGAAETGVIGETAEQYRERRIAELVAQRERERERVAAISGALVGAVAPDVHARGTATGPAGTVRVDGTVSGQALGGAAGEAIADATVSDVIQLAPGDVGAATLTSKVSIAARQPGACTVTAIADDPTVLASFTVVRVRDLDAEARARSAAQRAADPRLQARIAIQARLRMDALDVRGELVRYLTGECHARADHREYLRDEPLVVRAALRDYLVSLGANLRPPRPAPKPESPGAPPSDGAEWIAGEWTWSGIEWIWEAGVWRDAGVAVRDHRGESTTSVRDHRSDDRDHRDESPVVRDHRAEPAVRDHRDESAAVRDHRSETKPESKELVRDHRDDKKDDDKKDDKGPTVRDHRH